MSQVLPNQKLEPEPVIDILAAMRQQYYLLEAKKGESITDWQNTNQPTKPITEVRTYTR